MSRASRNVLRLRLEKAFLSFVFLCVAQPLFSQTLKDTLTEVKVHTRRNTSSDARINDFSPGQKVKTIDSATLQQYRMQSMAALLTQQVPVFVKSYGFNGLATLNFRGSSSAQSSVLWNGVPIQNAALGAADISALPVMLLKNVNIVYGGSAALWGSGNIGGAILLENEVPVFNSTGKDFSIEAGAGSFAQYQGGLSGYTSSGRWYVSGNALVQYAQNNFLYTDAGGARQQMPNSRLMSEAAMLQAAYQIADKNVISITGWYQQYNRQIPPELQEAYSVKNQIDGSFRLLADWNKVNGPNKWYIKSALTRDEVRYDDSAILLHTDNIVYQYYQEAGWKHDMRQWGKFLLFTPVQAAWLNGGSGTLKQQEKVALAAAWQFMPWTNRFNVSLNGRGEEIVNSGDSTITHLVFLPGANVSYMVCDWLILRGNIQYTYRAPSLNELYYFPGGNNTLKPEKGWSEDAGFSLKLRSGRFSFAGDLSVFTREIHDWILWIGGAIWTPHNIAAVHSRGVETENNLIYTAGKWKIHLGINTAYVLATTETSYIYNDGSIGKQIPYTPRYHAQLNAGFSFRNFTFNYNHTYTGYRFVTSDESYYLTPYRTGNLMLAFDATIRRRRLLLTTQVNNIWNEQYQVVAYRPMPGMNWLLGLKANILKGQNQ